MKKYLLLFTLSFFLTSCQEDKKVEGGKESSAQAASQPQAPDPARNVASPSAKVGPEVNSRPASDPPRSEEALTLRIPDVRAKKGEEICLEVKVKDFSNLLAMQYTINWDAALLEFKAVKDFGLPYLDQADFGFNRVKEGLLPFVWINDALQSTTIPDESTIYRLCFIAKGAAGQTAGVGFTERPTPFEVVNVNEEIQELNAEGGKVTIE